MSMKYFKIVLILIFLSLPITQAQAISGELLNNNFTDTRWIASINQLTVNTTINSLMLDQYNSTGGAYEDLTTYTEYEESGDLITDINATHVKAKCDLQYGRYLGFDFGTDHFINFTIKYAVYVNGRGNGGLNDVHYFHLNNRSSYGDRTDVTGTQDTFIELRILNDNDGDNYDIQFFSRTENTDIIQSSEINYEPMYQNWIYCEIFKEGSFVGANVYKWSNYTGEIFAYNGTHSRSDEFGYRFLYPVNTVDTNLYPGFWIDVWVKNVDLLLPHLHYYDTGSLYTTNLLVNSSLNAYSFYGLGSTPPGTSIELYLSDDNSTWSLFDSDTEWVEFLDSYNYTSLYAWMRLNSSDVSLTPLVDYYHLFYESPSTSGNNFGFSIVLLVLGFIVGIGSLRGNEK